jgi:hypothetical protein
MERYNTNRHRYAQTSTNDPIFFIYACVPQCAQIAPSSFKMIEDSGRARTYEQSSSLDVENAVMVGIFHFESQL